MSRSGYTHDCDGWDLIRWRGAVASAIRGKRGQAFLRELIDALDAMPEKKLASDLFQGDGQVCAIGRVAEVRGVDLSDLNTGGEEARNEEVARRMGIATALARELEFVNDDYYYVRDDERRWQVVRGWAERQLVEEDAE